MKKKGDENFKTREIDHLQNSQKECKIKNMTNKNKCADIFYEFDKLNAYMDATKFLQYKYVKNNALIII